MPVSRATSLRVRNVLDNWVPAGLRDNRLFMTPLLRLAVGEHARDFMTFKAKAFDMTPDEFADVYRRVAGSEVQGETDLNAACTEAILREVTGRRVLEVGCGRGWLAARMAGVASEVTASDIVMGEATRQIEGVTFEVASVEALPYDDDEFDVVVCTHTLEHVQDLPRALAELRRVARDALVVVVPRERPYRYSFNLHLHFFPYPWSWQAVAGVVAGARLEDLDDWFYVEPQR
ncbi:class I SAM-dependent methyltransferase [Knoellia flava]|uniref:Methyltransferase n=1 Tax=Knoellia flava TaxID=913969 RepID=A0A8H9FWT4_9MICO|nr:class I SAM-dependent methyltransferase [Knoellia flava]GGB84864.1 methyltransferase [Knoellia flava]